MPLLRRALAMALAVLGVVVLSSTPARAAEEEYYLDNVNSDMAMTVLNARTNDSQPVIQWPANNALPNNDKMWLHKRGGTANEYFIRPMHTNKCLAILNNSFALYARIVQATCTNDGIHDNDIWLREPVYARIGSQEYQIPQYRSKSSHLCIVVLSGSRTAGAELVQYTCNGSLNSLWWHRPFAGR
jgi:hypothetical protein